MHDSVQDNAEDSGWDDAFISAPDGLRLHLRDYRPARAIGRPVLCLPGLSRTAADFHEFATGLASDADAPHRVLALDYRGRGRSGYDRNPARYTLAVEAADIFAVMTALELSPAVLVGTSRGGLLCMLLATMRPTALAGAVLNDVGPVIEAQGLMRIKGYLGNLPSPRSFEEGADILRRLIGAQFPKLTASEWLRQARRTWEANGGRLAPRHDSKLAQALKEVDPERPLAPLWDQFDALSHVPVMVIRGANSDILSRQTAEAMRTRRPDLELIEVADQGHAPLLSEADIIRQIAGFITRCNAARA